MTNAIQRESEPWLSDILKKNRKRGGKAKNCQDTSNKLEKLWIWLIWEIVVRLPFFPKPEMQCARTGLGRMGSRPAGWVSSPEKKSMNSWKAVRRSSSCLSLTGRTGSVRVMLGRTSLPPWLTFGIRRLTSFLSSYKMRKRGMHMGVGGEGHGASTSNRRKQRQRRKTVQIHASSWQSVFFWESFKGGNCSTMSQNPNGLS